MSTPDVIHAPLAGTVFELSGAPGSEVRAGQAVLVLESMKVHVPVSVGAHGTIKELWVKAGDTVEKGAALFSYEAGIRAQTVDPVVATDTLEADARDELLDEFRDRQAMTLDAARQQATTGRHKKNYRTARQNLLDLVDADSFVEYGQLAVAAQRQRKDFKELQTGTAADGIITGVGSINGDAFANEACRAAIVVYDYSVLAGTQGFFHHQKLDRILAVAADNELPVIMYTEGGGGRPGDTDVVTMNTGLHCNSFEAWAGLCGRVPRIAVANGYNFAGNAALYGAADITIATKNSWIGMAGPAMIEGGGLGVFEPTEIGPIDVQAANGVVDIVADDEAQATDYAKRCLAIFQGTLPQWTVPDQSGLASALPANRRHTYAVREIINTLVDTGSFIELRQPFGGAIATGLARMQGHPIGLLASDCAVLGGAIDVDAGEKAADFMQLCNNFGIPLVSLSDTPGFMVGPEHEQRGAVRRLAKLFTAGSKLTVPMVGIVLRKCYGLGAQALLGGSTTSATHTAAWPTGEFGGMGLEGAVRLGFKRELDAVQDPQERQALFDDLLQQQYQRGKATEVATVLEVDAVIEPTDTRQTIIRVLNL